LSLHAQLSVSGPAPVRAQDPDAVAKTLWELVARRDLVAAATLAISSNNRVLGTLLSLAGSCSDVTQLMAAQLEKWREAYVGRGCVLWVSPGLCVPCWTLCSDECACVCRGCVAPPGSGLHALHSQYALPCVCPGPRPKLPSIMWVHQKVDHRAPPGKVVPLACGAAASGGRAGAVLGQGPRATHVVRPPPPIPHPPVLICSPLPPLTSALHFGFRHVEPGVCAVCAVGAAGTPSRPPHHLVWLFGSSARP
jgi:hypothetical protein